MIEVLKQALDAANLNERHQTIAESYYWLRQYKLLAEKAIAELESQEPVAHPERHELQAKGEHPAPCARHCEANAFQIVIKNLKAQLAQPEQEPVGYVYSESGVKSAAIQRDLPNGTPLFTSPPQRKPLTREQDNAICEANCNAESDAYFKARPQFDTTENRRSFEVGHRRGWLSYSPANGIKENT
jgi:hypothetical protein